MWWNPMTGRCVALWQESLRETDPMPRTGRNRSSSLLAVRVFAVAATLLLAGCGDEAAPGSDQSASPSNGGDVSASPDPSTTPSAQPGATGGDTTSGLTDLT